MPVTPPTASYVSWATRMIARWGDCAADLRRDPAPAAQIRAQCIESIVDDLRAALAGKSPTPTLPIARQQMDLFT